MLLKCLQIWNNALEIRLVQKILGECLKNPGHNGQDLRKKLFFSNTNREKRVEFTKKHE